MTGIVYAPNGGSGWFLVAVGGYRGAYDGEGPVVDRRGVFVSYARMDGEDAARQLAERLDAEGLEVWMDRLEMHGGRDWWQQIVDAIDRVSFLVLVMTPGAVASETTGREWRYARERGVCVYPVKASPDLDFEAMPTWMAAKHFYDLQDDEPWIAARAVFALARVADDRAMDALAGVATDERPELRVALAANIDRLAPSTATVLLPRLLVDSEAGVRKFAVLSVSTTDGEPVRERLRILADGDPSQTIRDNAAAKLRDLEG